CQRHGNWPQRTF
nr:immunoglobulin light chain junction region [Macaca mulatta]